jgi:phage baseplate assembly protein gpV
MSLRSLEDGPLLSTFQHRQSDFELLLEVAERAGLYFFARGDEVALYSGSGIGEPAVPLRLGSSLLEARVDLNGDPACRSVTVAGWDPLRAVIHGATVSTARVPHRGMGQLDVDAVGGHHETHIADQVLGSDAAAEALAQSVMDRRGAATATLWGIAEGQPELTPGALINVHGLPPHLADRYVVTSAVHRVTRQSGYTVEVDTFPPLSRAQHHNAAATLGQVSRVDDPEHLGRVRITLPSLGDLETDWLQVVVPAAGPDKGLISLPDVGDHVLILFLADEPTQGLVLGGLYGQEKPYDTGVDGGRTSRFSFRTGKGQCIRMDQGEDAITIENAEGVRVDLRGSEMRLHATEKMIIEAPKGSILFKANKIDFQRG